MPTAPYGEASRQARMVSSGGAVQASKAAPVKRSRARAVGGPIRSGRTVARIRGAAATTGAVSSALAPGPPAASSRTKEAAAMAAGRR